jgi:hypothetical protein
MELNLESGGGRQVKKALPPAPLLVRQKGGLNEPGTPGAIGRHPAGGKVTFHKSRVILGFH